MAKQLTSRATSRSPKTSSEYSSLVSSLFTLLHQARLATARSVNTIMTATYWLIGRQIVEFEQGGKSRADYGDQLLKRLGDDLSSEFGRGFSKKNLEQMRQFYLLWPIAQTVSAQSSVILPAVEITKKSAKKAQTVSAQLVSVLPSRSKPEIDIASIAQQFPLPWSAYVRLLSVKSPDARDFYTSEALRGGWSVRQLDRQIETQFFERSALSKKKSAVLSKGAKALQRDLITPEEMLKEPYLLEFLNLKDEYSESDLEEALIRNLENFLLELGGDFAFIGRQKRLRIGDEWYRIDLLFFQRQLRCLVLVDLKLGRFTHADAGQMHLYCNYAREHWTNEDENPPVGLILCAQKDSAVAHYSLEGLPNKVMAAEYKTALPSEKQLVAELLKAQQRIARRK